MDEATTTLATQGGIFGAFFVFVTVPLAIYARSLAKLLHEVQTARIGDAREVRDTLLATTREFNDSLREHIRASAAAENGFERLTGAIERLDKRVESVEDLVRHPDQRRR